MTRVNWGLQFSFNPTLVRLRPANPNPGNLSDFGFNPTLVRLRHANDHSLQKRDDAVSIPRWFD